MKRLHEMFRLTSGEQRVVVIVVLALLAAAIFQKHHEQTERTRPKQSSQPATTPNATEED
jgi:hypothetical protein